MPKLFWTPDKLEFIKSNMNLSDAEIADMINKYSNNEWNKLNALTMAKVGKKHSGRLLDGVEHNEYPKIESFNHSHI